MVQLFGVPSADAPDILNRDSGKQNIESGATADLRYNSLLAVDKLTGEGILTHSHTDNVTLTVGSNNGSSKGFTISKSY